MFSASDETCLIEELRASFSKIGALHPVIITQFGVAAGNNRLKAIPDWPVDNRTVKNLYEHICIEVADNIHEDKGREWFQGRVIAAANELISRGVKQSEIVKRIAEDFPMHPRTIYRYLPDEFKGGQGPKGPRPPKIDTCQFPDAGVGDKLGVDAGRDKLALPGSSDVLGSTLSSLVTDRMVEDRVGDGEASAAHAEDLAMSMSRLHSSPQSPNLRDVTSFPSPGESQVSEYTDAHVRLLEKLAGLPYVSEREFIREGEFTSEGKPKTWRVDCAFDYLVVEVEGAGSNSSHNPLRDDFFEGKGIHVLHLPNRCAECSKDDGFIRQAVEKLDRLSSKVVAMEHAEHDLLEKYRGSDAEKWRRLCVEKDREAEGLRQSITVLETQVNLAKTPSLPPKQTTPDAAVHAFKGTFNCKCGRVTPFTINSPVPLQHSDVKVDSTLEPTRRGGV